MRNKNFYLILNLPKGNPNPEENGKPKPLPNKPPENIIQLLSYIRYLKMFI